MFADFYISIVLTAILTIVIYKWFGDMGMSAFPVLLFLVISILSYALTAGVHWLIVAVF